MNRSIKNTILVMAIILITFGGIIYIAQVNNSFNSIVINAEYKSVRNIPQKLLDTVGEGIAAGKYINAYVDRVVDGDTIEIKYDMKFYKVRFLDVDTPESVKSGVTVQVYGKEASLYTKQLISGKQVKLIFEKGITDKYGRLLAFVFLGDDKCINALLVSNGFARVEIVEPNSTFKDYFYNLQKKAIQQKEGLWRLGADKIPFIKNQYGEYIPRYWESN